MDFGVFGSFARWGSGEQRVMRTLHVTRILALAVTGWAAATGCGGDSCNGGGTPDGAGTHAGGGAAGEFSSTGGGGFTDGGTRSGGGAAGELPSVDDDVYIVGDGEPPPCPGFDPYQDPHCGWQIILPSGVDFGREVGAGGAGGAGGAAGGGGGPASVCEIPLAFEVSVPNACILAVDCELLPKGPNTQGVESWDFDDRDAPAAIVLSDALCSRLVQEGFGRIDLRTPASCSNSAIP
jgi:hypothetical protein